MQQLKWFCLCLCFSCGSNRFHKLGCTQYAMHTQACSYNTKVNRHQSVMNKSIASAITFTRYFSSANFMSKANHSNKSQRNWCKVVHVPKNWYFWPNVGNNGKMSDNSYHSVHFKQKPFHEHLWCCIKQWPLPKGIRTKKDKTRLSKQCKSLIWMMILGFYVLICYRICREEQLSRGTIVARDFVEKDMVSRDIEENWYMMVLG